jgi:hypothetical protein
LTRSSTKANLGGALNMTSIERSVFPTLEVDRVKTGGLMRPFLEERQAWSAANK